MERLSAALQHRYRIEGQLGEGGMAAVYLADDLKHGRKVAVKVLKPELTAAVGTERFLSEIRTTANLRHPHILPLFDSGEAGGLLFYVTPFIDGQTLRERLEDRGTLPIPMALAILRDVAAALTHANGRGVLHRDIKPSNILLEGDEALVADFGIALATWDEGAADRLTAPGSSIGTPEYMSPEQIGGEELSPRSDVYGLGCLLYEMLTGEPPFTGSHRAVVSKDPYGATEVRTNGAARGAGGHGRRDSPCPRQGPGGSVRVRGRVLPGLRDRASPKTEADPLGGGGRGVGGHRSRWLDRPPEGRSEEPPAGDSGAHGGGPI